MADRRCAAGGHGPAARPRPTIVAGVAMLLEVFDAFGLGTIEVSEHDILWGAALEAATN